MRRFWATALALGVASGSYACSSDVELSVDVRTDLVPGVEFTVARAQVDDDSSRATARRASFGEDWTAGVRTGDFAAVGEGEHRIRATLVDDAGMLVVEREVWVTISSSRVVNVLLTRDCRGRSCGAPASACLGGRCVDPHCSSTTTTRCGDPACAHDSDCAAGSACVQPRCLEGACVALARAGACATGEYCDPALGCRSTGALDAGAYVDAGSRDDAGGSDGGFGANDSGTDAATSPRDAAEPGDAATPPPPSDAGEPGLCTSAADRTAVTASYDGGLVDDIAWSCVTPCLGATPRDACITSCIAMRTALSDGCATCWGASTSCVETHCLSACLSSLHSVGCTDCLCANCRTGLAMCTGLASGCP